MATFLGIGLGPIQTGIFMAGAVKGGFDRIVIAEVNEELKKAVNAAGKITISIASAGEVHQESCGPVEVYNPADPADKEKLIAAAAEASELATALPSIKFFSSCKWLAEGFRRQPERLRFVYTAENNNHAAEALAEALGETFPKTYFLNTVIGKMSGMFKAADGSRYPLLAPGAPAGHLVEEFNTIYISGCPEIEKRKVANLHVKDDLLPFEEAKLYGHNATHFLLGMLGRSRGCGLMNEIAGHPDLMKIARDAFIMESGAALIRKYGHLCDELFTEKGFTAYAEGLLVRMTNPFLQDAVARITRDIDRKLGWDDRVVGTMRLCLEHGIEPVNFAKGGKLAMKEFTGDLHTLWPAPWSPLHEKLQMMLED